MNRFNEPVRMYTTTFEHVYFISGFAISEAIAKNGTGGKPKSKHACMECGYWCNKNILDTGLGTIPKYFALKIHRFFNNLYIV